MDALFDLFGDGDVVLMAGGIAGALAVALVLAVLFNMLRSREEVRRRADESLGNGPGGAVAAAGPKGAKGGADTVARLFALAEKAFAGADKKGAQILRRKLTQAGFYNADAVTWFFAARAVAAVVLGIVGFIAVPIVVPMIFTDLGTTLTLAFHGFFIVVGYALPSIYIGRRVEARIIEVKEGFPDYLDLMVVCAEAGLSMEASIERVSREIAPSYPALAENLYITCLEIRAGRTVSEALDRLAQRLGVEEAKSFATLLQQSEELGSSIVHSLKIYSDDMRNKRMMKAEEKAYALPAKLVVPLTLFIFPVLLVVLLLPVVIRVSQATF